MFVAAVSMALLLTSLGGDSAPSRRSASLVPHSAHAKLGAPAFSREDRAVERVARYTPFVVGGGGRRREIALTFDDGPGPYTPAVLRTLRRLRAPATFFQVGQSISTFRTSAVSELRGRYPIGDHTQNHVQLARFGMADQRGQILKAAAAIRSYGAPFPRLFRPPYRSFNRTTLDVMRQLRMVMILWTVDSGDYMRGPAATIAKSVLTAAKPGGIVLMHDAGGTRTHTIAALPAIVRGLRRRGFRLVTVPRLLLDDPPARGRPLAAPPGPGR